MKRRNKRGKSTRSPKDQPRDLFSDDRFSELYSEFSEDDDMELENPRRYLTDDDYSGVDPSVRSDRRFDHDPRGRWSVRDFERDLSGRSLDFDDEDY